MKAGLTPFFVQLKTPFLIEMQLKRKSMKKAFITQRILLSRKRNRLGESSYVRGVWTEWGCKCIGFPQLHAVYLMFKNEMYWENGTSRQKLSKCTANTGRIFLLDLVHLIF